MREKFLDFSVQTGLEKVLRLKFLRRCSTRQTGTATVAGLDIEKQAPEIRKIIGVQSQDTSVNPELTGRENMILEGHLQQMRGKELEDRVDSLLSVVGLKDAADKRAGRYSGGMKKRLDLASVLVHKPKVMFLDEPTTGLDPQSRAGVWDYLEQLNKTEGITIFLTTQYLEEADRLCQRLCIVDGGKIVAQGTPAELKAEIGADAVTITMKDSQGKSDDSVRAKGKQIVQNLPNIVGTVDSGDGITIYIKNGGYFIPESCKGIRQV